MSRDSPTPTARTTSPAGGPGIGRFQSPTSGSRRERPHGAPRVRRPGTGPRSAGTTPRFRITTSSCARRATAGPRSRVTPARARRGYSGRCRARSLRARPATADGIDWSSGVTASPRRRSSRCPTAGTERSSGRQWNDTRSWRRHCRRRTDSVCACSRVWRRRSPSGGAEQAAVLTRAADRLGPHEDSRHPVAAAFTDLRACGVLGGFSVPASPGRSGAQPGVVRVRFSDYALSAQDDRLPVLPIVVDLFRRLPNRPPRQALVDPVAEGWRLEVAFGEDSDPDGLLNAPIRSPA